MTVANYPTVWDFMTDEQYLRAKNAKYILTRQGWRWMPLEGTVMKCPLGVALGGKYIAPLGYDVAAEITGIEDGVEPQPDADWDRWETIAALTNDFIHKADVYHMFSGGVESVIPAVDNIYDYIKRSNE